SAIGSSPKVLRLAPWRQPCRAALDRGKLRQSYLAETFTWIGLPRSLVRLDGWESFRGYIFADLNIIRKSYKVGLTGPSCLFMTVSRLSFVLLQLLFTIDSLPTMRKRVRTPQSRGQ